MMLTSAVSVDLVNISMANAGIVALLGYAVVFFGLILLMLVIMAMGKVFIARDAKLAAQKASKEAELAAVPVAPHTKGEIVLPAQKEDAKSTFDPYDENQVDLEGIVGALPKGATP